MCTMCSGASRSLRRARPRGFPDFPFGQGGALPGAVALEASLPLFMLLPLFFRRPFGHLSYHTLPSAQILARRCPQFLLLSKLRAAAAGGRFGRGAWPTA